MAAWIAQLAYLILDKLLIIPLINYFKQKSLQAADDKKAQDIKDATDKAQTEQERIDAARRSASGFGD